MSVVKITGRALMMSAILSAPAFAQTGVPVVPETPAAPMLLQMVLLALAFGFSMAVAERSGAPRQFA